MKKFSAILSIAALTVFLTGCNTVNGIGKDVERGGEKVQDVSKDVKNKM